MRNQFGRLRMAATIAALGFLLAMAMVTAQTPAYSKIIMMYFWF